VLSRVLAETSENLIAKHVSQKPAVLRVARRHPLEPRIPTVAAQSVIPLLGADDLEVLVDEDVVRPVDANIVDLVSPAAQLHYTVDDASWVGSQR
jgi:hypothetical protein